MIISGANEYYDVVITSGGQWKLVGIMNIMGRHVLVGSMVISGHN